MKKTIYLIFILTNLIITSNIYAKELVTSQGIYPLNLYNVAIVGNSHASFMSNFLGIDNDLHCLTIGNHSIGGDDIPNWGLVSNAYTNNKELIAIKGECKGWINQFITDSPNIDYAICWFGSNSINKDINQFKEEYINWIKKVREKSNCKLLLMSIPYNNFPEKKEYQTNENIDKFNEIIRQIKYELNDKNIYYVKINNYDFIDKVHLTKESYKNIWNIIAKQFNIKIKQVNNVKLNNFNNKIAIVGNSHGYFLSKATNIDDDLHITERTNNSVGASYIWSKDREISTFPNRAKNYDYCILFFGTNELMQNYSYDYYFERLQNYITKIHTNNDKLKIYMVEIPKLNTNRMYDNLIDTWNNKLKEFSNTKEYLTFYNLINVEFMDELHLSDKTSIDIMNHIQNQIGELSV